MEKKEVVCSVVGCENKGTVIIGVTVNNDTRDDVTICQGCWEDLNFNNVQLKFKEPEKKS